MNEPFTLAIGKDVREILENDLVLERDGLPEGKLTRWWPPHPNQERDLSWCRIGSEQS